MGFVGELLGDIKDGNFGFKMEEMMIGRHWYEEGEGPDGPHYIHFKGEWGPSSMAGYLNPSSDKFMSQPIEGSITIDGFCDEAPMKGTLTLDYFGEHKLRYDFDFKVKGKKYHYVGEKVNIKPWNLPTSHTTCFGRLTEAEGGKLLGTSVTFFRWRDAPGFLASFRVVR